MSNVHNIFTKEEVVFSHPQWTEIGVHIDYPVACGQDKETVIFRLVNEGIPEFHITSYLESYEQHFSEGLKQISALYSTNENTIIQFWIRANPYQPGTRGPEGKRAGHVAKIVLFSVIIDLPIWDLVHESGELERNSEHPVQFFKKRDKLLKPLFLFDITRSDSEAGMSWPEAYYLTYLPGYNFYVLTVSHDSTEVHGTMDLALDLIYPKKDGYPPIVDAVEAIKRWWGAERDGWNQGPWESLSNTGCCDPYLIERVKDEVWSNNLY